MIACSALFRVVRQPVLGFTGPMLLRRIRSLAVVLVVAALLPLTSALATTQPAPAPRQFTIQPKERIVLYVADG